MYIKLIEKVLTKSESKKLISHTLHTQKLEYIKTYNSVTKESTLNDSFNRRKGVDYMDPFVVQYRNRLLDVLNKEKITPNKEYNFIRSFKFNSYEESDFLNYHSDVHEIMHGATITMVLQLNEDYEGGEFCYMIDGIEHIVPKKTGSVIIFESQIPHKINMVTKGTRYSINVWPKYNENIKNGKN